MSIFAFLKNNKWVVYLFCSLALFVAFFPLANSVDFAQNDDWVYRLNASTMMGGDFSLHPYLGPTFILQGLLGAAFGSLFSIEKLSGLTLFMSCLNLFLFMVLVQKKASLSLYQTLLVGLFFYFNPLNVYTSIGFMTSQYFFTFLFLTLLSLEFYFDTQNKKYLLLAIVLSFFAMNVRQVILFVPLSLFLFQLLQKNFKESIYGLVWFICFYLYFVLIFPQTPRMVEVPLQFHHIVKPHYLYAIVYGILIYLAVFLAPFFIGFTSQLYIKNRRSTLLVFFAFFLSLVLYFVLPANYKPDAVSWGEFPYFENTFERTGFYPRGIHGTKYQFKGIYDLYYYLDILAKILVSVGIGALLFLKKRLNNFYTFLIATYFAIMVVVETFYDRYILILIPLVIIWFFEMKYKLTNINKLLVSGFLLAFMFLSYQFAMDFILVNRYVWNRAEQLAHEQAIDKNLIQATNPWKLQYRNLKKDYIYNFSYDSQSVNPDYANLYELVEEKEVNFKYSIFIEPKIYLYKLK